VLADQYVARRRQVNLAKKQAAPSGVD